MLQAFSVGVELDSSAALEQEAPCLHPARRARVLVAGHAVGVLGELHPEVVDSLPIDGRPIYAELDLGKLLDAIGERGVPQANEPPKFPMVRRDLALVVEEAVEVGRLQSELLEAAGGLAESVALFDLYRGEHVPDGHKSVALRIVYRDPTGTLTDKKVDKAHAKLGRMACETFGATLR
jgi:phenylalanyl-tRNA synthetase beta chain